MLRGVPLIVLLSLAGEEFVTSTLPQESTSGKDTHTDRYKHTQTGTQTDRQTNTKKETDIGP